MIHLKKLAIVVGLICLSSTGFWVVQANSDLPDFDLAYEKWQIKKTIEEYFDSRYSARIGLQMDEIESIIENFSVSESTSFTEMDKLEIELYNAEINHLRYLEYEIFLKFDKIDINEQLMTATASVIEGHDVVFEATTPFVSSLRNLNHIITLQKQDNSWKIVSDVYEDDLWRMLNNSLKTKEEILDSIQLIETQLNSATNLGDSIEFCTLAPDNSSHIYNREGAVNYAHTWAYGRNLKYDDYSGLGGDCTNFVSQAIHEGGNASMEFGGSHGIGTIGWYYYNAFDRAASWNFVDRLYSFIVNETETWSKGPEGCEIDYSLLQIGDIVQIERQGDEVWDHSLIIVEKIPGPYGPQYLVAAHSDDIDYYPLAEITYEDIRFIHIERIDGVIVNLPVILRGNNQIPEGQEAYPAPMDMAVDDQIIEGDSSYPAP